MTRPSRKRVGGLATLIVAGAIVLGVISIWIGMPGGDIKSRVSPSAGNHASDPPRPTRRPDQPTLYCEFYDFTHSATIASFYFTVTAPETAQPRYAEAYAVDSQGSRTDYGRDGETERVWVFGTDDGAAALASPADDTLIKLYGLKPQQPGVFWTEAGIRGTAYKNLEGKCRQAHFGHSQSKP